MTNVARTHRTDYIIVAKKLVEPNDARKQSTQITAISRLLFPALAVSIW